MVSILKKLFSYGMSPDTTMPDNITVSQPSCPLMAEEHYYYNTFDNKIIEELQKKQNKSNKFSIAIQSSSEVSIIPKNFTRKPKFQPKLCTELIDIIPPPVVEEPPPAQEVPQGKSVTGGLGAPKGQIKLSLGGASKPSLSSGAAPTLNMSNGAAGTSIPKLQLNMGSKKDDDKSKDAKPTTGLKLSTPSIGGGASGGLKLAAPKLSLSTPAKEESKPAEAPSEDKPAETAAAPAKPGGLSLSIPKLGTTAGAKPGGLSLSKPGLPAAKTGGLSLSIPKPATTAPAPAASKEPEAPAETTTTTATTSAPAPTSESKPGFNFSIPKPGAPKTGGLNLSLPKAPATGAKPGIPNLSIPKVGSGLKPLTSTQPAATETAPPAAEPAPAAEQPPASETTPAPAEQPAPEPAPAPAETKPSTGISLGKPGGLNLPKLGGFNLSIPGKPAAKPAEEQAPVNTSAAQAPVDEWAAAAGQPPPPTQQLPKPNLGLGLSVPTSNAPATTSKGWGAVNSNSSWQSTKIGTATSGWNNKAANGWGTNKPGGGWNSSSSWKK